MKRALRPQLLGVAAVILFVAAFVFVASASATHGQPGKQLPFRGVLTGSISVDFAPGFPFARSTFGGRCSVPSDFVVSWSGTGEATHLGLLTGVGSDCDRLDLATGLIVYDDGRFSYTVANGDTVNGTYTNGHGSLAPGTLATDEWTLVGGTGRFASVTGEGVDTLKLDLTAAPPTFVLTSEGWVAYDASQQS